MANGLVADKEKNGPKHGDGSPTLQWAGGSIQSKSLNNDRPYTPIVN